MLPSDAPRHAEKHHEWDGKGQRPATPEDYGKVQNLLTDYDAIKPGSPFDKGLARFVVTKKIGDETFRAVFEVRPGKKNRAVALVSLSIKT